MEKDWIFKTSEYICDLRVAGVLICNGKLLVQRDKAGTEFALPGGHVKIGETMENALIREYKEEMDAAIQCKRILWTEECFWEWNRISAHNISFYYLVELFDESDIPDTQTFMPHKDNANVVYGWIPIEQLKNIIIYPEFIKQEIYSLDSDQKHFVTKA